MNDIPTPRTEAYCRKGRATFPDGVYVSANFARQLERELVEAKDTLDNALVDHDRLQQENYALEKRLTEAKTYKDAIDSNLICADLGVANGKPKEELQALINWEIGVHEFFEVDKLKQELAASQAREAQLLGALSKIAREGDPVDAVVAKKAINQLPPPPIIPLAEVKALVSLLQTIHDDADGYADGAPDASSHDKLCAQLVDLTRPLLSIIKSKHPELV